MHDGPPRVLVFGARGPSWPVRAAAAAWVLFVLSVAALVIVPVLVVGLAAIAAGAAWIGLRVVATRLRGGGRRNVRVIQRD